MPTVDDVVIAGRDLVQSIPHGNGGQAVEDGQKRTFKAKLEHLRNQLFECADCCIETSTEKYESFLSDLREAVVKTREYLDQEGCRDELGELYAQLRNGLINLEQGLHPDPARWPSDAEWEERASHRAQAALNDLDS